MVSGIVSIITYLPSVMLFIIGILFVFLGWSRFVLTQKIRNIPVTKTDSAAVGLVELYGKAVPIRPIETHIDKTSCVLSKLSVERYSDFRQAWYCVAIHQKSSPFYIEDGNGKVLVDPIGAEFKLRNRNFSHDVFLLSDGKIATQRRQIKSETHLSAYEFSAGPIQDFLLSKPSGQAGLDADFNLKYAELSLPSDENQETEGQKFAIGLNTFLNEDANFAIKFRSLGPGVLRISEQIILQDKNVYVLGDAELNSGPGELDPSENLVIRKGREKVLYISDFSEKQALSAVDRQTALFILIGAICMITGLFFV